MNRALREIIADSRQAFHLPGLGKVSTSLGPIIQVARNAACPFHPALIRDRIGETNGRDSFTMTKDDIQLLYAYDRWANNRVLQAVAALRPEQFTRELGGSLRSVRDTLVHIIGGEWGWLTYWKASSHSAAFLADLWDRHDVLFHPDAFPDLTAIRLKWEEVEKEQVEFVSSVTEEALVKMLPIRATQLSLAHLMQHLANHSTYHRGQVALMMRQLRAEPSATDFHLFLVEASRVSATGLTLQ